MDRDTYISIECEDIDICCCCKKKVVEDEYTNLLIDDLFDKASYKLCLNCAMTMENTKSFFICSKCKEINFFSPEDTTFQDIDGTNTLCEVISEDIITPVLCIGCEVINQ